MDEHDDADEAEIPTGNLRDLVTVAAPPRMPEAIYLAEKLEEAGIPALAEPQLLDGVMPGTRVYVPRQFAEQARALIAKAQSDAEAQAVDQAFDIENIADSTSERPESALVAESARLRAEEQEYQRETLMAMFALRAESPEARDEQLRKHVVRWLLDGVLVVEMAKYLAAAGVTREEAEQLVDEVAQAQGDAYAAASSMRMLIGVLLLVLGLLGALAIATTAALEHRVPYWRAPLILFAAGLVFIYSAKRRMATLRRKKADEEHHVDK